MTDFGNVQRLDLHNVSVDEELATKFHRCGQIHLPTGRRCLREEHHRGSCDFADPNEVDQACASIEHMTSGQRHPGMPGAVDP